MQLSTTIATAMFFCGAGLCLAQTATFAGTDTSTQGSWKGAYGAAGYAIPGDATPFASNVVAAIYGSSQYTWSSSTSDVRAPQKASGTDRIAGSWFSWTNFSIDLNFSDQNTHQVAIYCLDWDYNGRNQRINVLSASGALLDTRTVSNFSGGTYLIWNITGHVQIQTVTQSYTNAAVSGVFFGAASGSVTTAPPSPSSPSSPSGSSSGGSVPVIKRTGSSFDPYATTTSSSMQQTIRNDFSRLAVYTPFFDNRTSWYGNALAYVDSYAIYTNAVPNPDWVMRDPSGSWLYISWGCNGSTCPQYAGDFSNQGFRQWWVNNARQIVAKGYKGLWIDDVNMDFRISNGAGNPVVPLDRNTGQPMTEDNWRRYMAEFMEYIRSSLPGVELLHNSVWYTGGPSRDANSYVQREIAAADDINIEAGINDPGLTGGTGVWSVNAVLAYADRVNAMGKHVIIDGIAQGNAWDTAGKEYGLAGYFLVSNGNDLLGDWGNVADPGNWWAGFNVQLGSPTGGRSYSNGLYRRDFTGGIVLLNDSWGPWTTVNLPGTYRRIDGSYVTSVSLGPNQAAVLMK